MSYRSLAVVACSRFFFFSSSNLSAGLRRNFEGNLHLLAAVDQTLLLGRDAFFFFDALLYALDLFRVGRKRVSPVYPVRCSISSCSCFKALLGMVGCGVSLRFIRPRTALLCLARSLARGRLGICWGGLGYPYLVVGLDVQLDLLASEGADSVLRWMVS